VDGLGSTRALTDINGLLTDAYAYEAFGEIIKQLGNTLNSYLFAGEQRDPNLGLDYLRARYLDVNSGRFPSRDYFEGSFWIPETLHKYLYANANPILFIDPSGLFTLTELFLVQEIQGILRSGQTQAAAFGGRRIVLKAGCFIVEEIVANLVTEGIYLFIDELKFPGRPYAGQSNKIDRRLKEHIGSRLKDVDNVLTHFNMRGSNKQARDLLEQWVLDILEVETNNKTSNIRQVIGNKRQGLRNFLDQIKLCK
jgi:RHS repeat-associated protein